MSKHRVLATSVNLLDFGDFQAVEFQLEDGTSLVMKTEPFIGRWPTEAVTKDITEDSEEVKEPNE